MTRRRGIIAGIALALLLLGYACGRYVAPERVVTKDRVVTVDKVVTVEKIRTETQQVKVADVQRDIRYVRVKERRPDGTVTETTSRVDLTKEHGDLIHVDLAQAEATKERLVYQDHEKVKLVERARPNWSVAVLPGIDLSLRPSVAAVVDRRVAGPLSVGLWASSAKVAGLAVRLEF